MKKILFSILILFAFVDILYGATTVEFTAPTPVSSDTIIHRGTSWPPVTFQRSAAASYIFSTKNSSGTYFIDIAFFEFNTSSLPDDCTITSAKLRLRLSNKYTSQTIGVAYYPFTTPSNSDYVMSQTNNACSFSSGSLNTSSLTDISISNLDQISKDGNTCFRFVPDTTFIPTTNVQYGGSILNGSYAVLSITYENSGYSKKINGQTIKKIMGVTPKKIFGL